MAVLIWLDVSKGSQFARCC